MVPCRSRRRTSCIWVDPDQTAFFGLRHYFDKDGESPVMANNKLFGGYHPVQDRSRVAVHRYLHWTGTGSWRREATILLSVLVALMAGYFTVFHFASLAVQDLVDTCTARLEIELENANTDPLTKALARPLCECVAHSFLDKTVSCVWPWSTCACLIRWLLNP